MNGKKTMSKKYIFESKHTKKRRRFRDFLTLNFLTLFFFGIFCFYIVLLGQFESEKTLQFFYKRGPDAVVIGVWDGLCF